MHRVLPFLIFFLSVQLGFSQAGFWQDVDEATMSLAPDAHREVIPSEYRTVQLQKSALENYLSTAELSNSLDVENPIQLEIPLPNGENEIYEVVYDPIMPPTLAARYPSARTYMARSLDRKSYMRFDVTKHGFHAAIKTAEGVVFIAPYATNDVKHYISYYTRHEGGEANFSCGTHSDAFPELASAAATMPMDLIDKDKPLVKSRGSVGIVERREYRAAVACVGEWGLGAGGTVADAMAKIVTAMNILNMFFETEHALRFTLVENNDLLAFVVPNMDPYANIQDAGGLLGQNVAALNDIIGFGNYDIGHVFTNGCADGIGGIAGGAVCTQSKGAGVTCFFSSNVTSIVTNVMAHEIAHQFSSAHTWSNCPGSEDQRASGSAYEPGSGTTIMSYSGTCGAENITPAGFGDYYHVESLDQVYTFSHEAAGNSCGEDITNSNNYPEFPDWPYTDGFFIPMSTPFELEVEAIDPDGDPLTYCWEQYNLGPLSPLGLPTNNSPIFRSYPPNVNPKRVFPRLNKILANAFEETEVMPSYARDLNFRLTARDNRVDGGGATWQEVEFHVAGNAGPFEVMNPNTNITWNAGDFTEVTWDVANTNASPVNCEFVNISLSTDGGLTYPFTLVENTPNTGSAMVTVPNVTTGTARVRVDAADNIFFDISNANFTVEPSMDTTFATSVSPVYQQLCLPTSTDLTINTFGLNGFNSAVTATIMNTLPTNAVPTFTNNGATAGSDINLNLDLSNVVSAGTFDVELMMVADTDTAFRTITLETISNDFSSLALTFPVTGSSGVVGTPTFEWVDVPDAQFYDIQISTSPAFGTDDIVDEAFGMTNTFYDVTVLLDISTIHYWRVRPSNICGNGEWTEIGAFHTEALSCAVTQSDNVPINIPSQGTPTVESTITILSDGLISDINIPTLVGLHNLVKHMDVSLISPAGTEVVLFSDLCGNTTTFNFGLDDEAPFEIPCPPLTGQVHRPQNPLSTFIGESTMGTWTLRLEVVDNDGEGGSLTDWSLDFCSNVVLSAPFLVTNNPLVTPPLATSNISGNLLKVEDNNNNANELLYTIIDVPLFGTLLYDGDPVVPGTQFTQGAINDFRVAYAQDGSNVTEDNFTFNVSDQEGGWLGILAFNIEIDPAAPVSTTDLEDINSITLFPNPTSNDFSILFDEAVTGKLNVTVMNVQGQEVISNNYNQVNDIIRIGGTELPSGVYFVRVTTDTGIFAGKITVQ